MWYAFIQLHLLMQRLFRLSFIYDEATKRFKLHPKKNYIYYWTDGQIFLIFVVSVFRIGAFLKSSEDDVNVFESFIMDLLYFGLVTVCLSVIWTLEYRKRDAVWFLNQAMSLKKKEELDNKELTIATLAMYSLGFMAALMPPALAFLPFVFNDTPANIILRAALPKLIMEKEMVETILSSLYWIFHGFCAVFPVIQLLAVVVLIFFDSNFMVKPCYEPRIPTSGAATLNFTMIKGLKRKLAKGKEEPGTSAPKNNAAIKPEPPNKKINKFKLAVQTANQFPIALKTYRKIALIFKSLQSFGYVFFPSLVFCSFLLNVVSTYVCIKLNDKLPILLVGMMGVVDITIFINTVTTYMFAWVITTETEKFLDFWRGRLIRKFNQMKLKSCKRIVIWIGSFFALHQAITLEHLMQVVDMTTNILLAG